MGSACFQLFQEGEQNSHVDEDEDEADDDGSFDGDGDNYDDYEEDISTGVCPPSISHSNPWLA